MSSKSISAQANVNQNQSISASQSNSFSFQLNQSINVQHVQVVMEVDNQNNSQLLSSRSDKAIPDEGEAMPLDKYSEQNKHISLYNPLRQCSKHPIIASLLKQGMIKEGKDMPQIDKSQEFLTQGCFRDHLTPFEKGIKIFIKWTAILEIDQMKQSFDARLA